jgi:hypothetical protein
VASRLVAGINFNTGTSLLYEISTGRSEWVNHSAETPVLKNNPASMTKSILIFALTFALFSCNALKESPKYKLTDGLYKTKIKDGNVWVYVENADDSISVYQLEKGWKRLKPQPERLKPQVYPVRSAKEVIAASRYRKNTFDLDVLTIPFKFRPSTSSFSPQLSNHLNGALYAGYRNDTYEVSYNQNPVGQISQRIIHLGISAGLATGIGVTPLNPWVTQNNINVEYDGFVWSKAACIILAVEKLNFGLALGIDHLLDANRRYWIYQGKPYLGLTVGLNLN